MHYEDLAGSGYVIDHAPDALTDRLRSAILGDLTPHNPRLAGHLHSEHLIGYVPELDHYLRSLIHSFDQNCPHYLRELDLLFGDLPINLGATWVNRQKATEFNPLHNHGGVFSFVLWLQVPYSRDHEQQLWPEINSVVLNGALQFVYATGINRLHTHNILVDSSFEGQCCLFPSNLMHTVYPFYTSSQPRISISGNYKLGHTEPPDQ